MDDNCFRGAWNTGTGAEWCCACCGASLARETLGRGARHEERNWGMSLLGLEFRVG
jgi:hypothetical protein